MFKDRLLKFLSITISAGIAVWIFFNPLTQGAVGVHKIELISYSLNEIIKAIGFSLKLSTEKFIDSVFFLEYMFFGISLMITTKLFFEKTTKNIFFPLFVGLLTSVLLVYKGCSSKIMFFEVSSIILMFKGLLLGIAMFLTIEIFFGKFKINKGTKKSKYRRGR